jgi:hypothetical protein
MLSQNEVMVFAIENGFGYSNLVGKIFHVKKPDHSVEDVIFKGFIQRQGKLFAVVSTQEQPLICTHVYYKLIVEFKPYIREDK